MSTWSLDDDTAGKSQLYTSAIYLALIARHGLCMAAIKALEGRTVSTDVLNTDGAID